MSRFKSSSINQHAEKILTTPITVEMYVMGKHQCIVNTTAYLILSNVRRLVLDKIHARHYKLPPRIVVAYFDEVKYGQISGIPKKYRGQHQQEYFES